jgi:hypothetical protein
MKTSASGGRSPRDFGQKGCIAADKRAIAAFIVNLVAQKLSADLARGGSIPYFLELLQVQIPQIMAQEAAESHASIGVDDDVFPWLGAARLILRHSRKAPC